MIHIWVYILGYRVYYEGRVEGQVLEYISVLSFVCVLKDIAAELESERGRNIVSKQRSSLVPRHKKARPFGESIVFKIKPSAQQEELYQPPQKPGQ